MSLHRDATIPHARGDAPSDAKTASLPGLMLGAVGVVFGDIGTSPLYAFRESLAAVSGNGLDDGEIVGVASLLVWALVLVVTGKYVIFVLRADNRGEGGLLSLMALAQRGRRGGPGIALALGIAGAALFYGDAAITPAISVLSAVEGLTLVAPGFAGVVMPVAIAVLVALFLVQRHGTRRMGALFGPVTAIWFAVLATLGAAQIVEAPAILNALNPLVAAGFLLQHGFLSLVVLGAVFLSVTGAEALYADLGHFGRTPIRLVWLAFVFPALVLNYLGQGALVLGHPEAAETPFFLLAPGWALMPLVVLATLATVIASQAVITGAYSLSQQAVQLGLLPRLSIRHTSESMAGQIFMPQVNRVLLLAVLLLVVVFESSSGLAAAYGIAVTGTMVVTTCLLAMVMRRLWRWSPWRTALVVVPFLAIDLTFAVANLTKVLHGGYVPILLAAALATIMWTWRKGTGLLLTAARNDLVPVSAFIASLARSSVARVEGTAIFLTADADYVPAALLHNLKHNKVLHAQNALVTVRTLDTPRVERASRVEFETLSRDFVRITVNFGYMERPNIPRALLLCREHGFAPAPMATPYFMSRRSFVPSARSGMPLWQDKLFIALAGQASNATEFFAIPPSRSVELGSRMVV